MINYLKAKRHKGIDVLIIEDLAKINILCGKNNSGKTSLFEALCDSLNFSIGKKIDCNFLIELYLELIANATLPAPHLQKSWIDSFLSQAEKENPIWYHDDEGLIVMQMKESWRNDKVLSRYIPDENIFRVLLEKFFIKIISYYKPILIPPKRMLATKVAINFQEAVSPNGIGIINRLFYLKNQDLESKEYKKFLSIYSQFKEITGMNFNIIPDSSNNQISLFFKEKSDWIGAEDCGLGLSDLIIILTLLVDTDSNFIFIEEPENHLHANYQKKLLQNLKRIKSKQFFISTHSSVFLDINAVDKIFYIENKEKVIVNDQTSKSEIINSLGYSVSENLVSDLIILPEGPTDIPILKKIFSWIGISDTYNIKYWPLGGDIMSQLDLSVFSERKNIFALIDSDPGSSVQRTRFKKKCDIAEIYCRKLDRYSIENYLSIKAIRKIFPKQISVKIKSLEHNKKVDKQIGFEGKNKSIKSKAYDIINIMELKRKFDFVL